MHARVVAGYARREQRVVDGVDAQVVRRAADLDVYRVYQLAALSPQHLEAVPRRPHAVAEQV